MGPIFRVYLNNQFLENEPKGLIETELTIKRDETLKGVFFDFTSELVFWGDGYQILKNIRDNQEGCAQVPCNIEFRCAETRGWEVLYQAVIPLGSKDVEWDDYNCEVMTRLENADLSNLLRSYGDVVVKLNTPTTIDNNTVLAPITQNLTEFSGDFSGGALTDPVPSYLFTDALQQTLSYLSNNAIDLVADPIYSTLFLAQVLEFDFIDPLTAGDTLILTFTNYYNQEYEINFVAPVGSSGFIITEFLTRALHMENAASGGRTNYLEKAQHFDDVNVVITNYAPWKSWSISVNGGAKDATITETQAFQYGLKNLAITTSTSIQEQTSPTYVTLNELMAHASQMHNMGFVMTRTGSGFNFNLTYLPDLLDDNSTGILLNQVKDQKTKTTGEYNLNSYTTAAGHADAFFQPFTWNARNCYGENSKSEAEHFSTQEFFDLINTAKSQDDAIYYAFLEEGDYTRNASYPVRFGSVNPGPNPALTGYTYYNMPYAMPFLIKRNEIYFANNDPYGDIPVAEADTFATCSNCPTATITNENTVIIKNVTNFEYPLRYSQVRTLIDNSLLFVSFTDGKTATKKGFIQELVIPFKNFISSFKLYTD